jgi:hypothetical protein
LQLRIALFFSSASLSGAFSGLLAYGIIRLDGRGDLAGWSWIFIVRSMYQFARYSIQIAIGLHLIPFHHIYARQQIEGLFTFLWGVVSFFIFPASIESSKYLNHSEKA